MRLLNPRTYTQLSPAVRAEAIKAVVGFAAMVASAALLAAETGFTVSFDPDDPDFLKLVLPDGKRKYDIAAGFGPILRFYWQLGKSVAGILPERGRAAIGLTEKSSKVSRDTLSEAGRFAESKLSGVPSYLTQWLLHDWKNMVGETQTPAEAAIVRALPLMGQDFKKEITAEGTKGLVPVLPALLGAGFQNYESKRSSRLLLLRALGDLLPNLSSRPAVKSVNRSAPGRPARPTARRDQPRQ